MIDKAGRCPADHQKFVFLDTGLPSHPLMDDEGSQSNETPQNSRRERGAARDQEMARSDPNTNTHALLAHIAKLQAQLVIRKARTILMDYFSSRRPFSGRLSHFPILGCTHARCLQKQHRTLAFFSWRSPKTPEKNQESL